jgi:hypothetical protein
VWFISQAHGEHVKQKDPYMFEIISQLENAAELADDYARDAGEMLFEKEDTVEWKAAQTLRGLFAAQNELIDNSKFTEDGVFISYLQFAIFLKKINQLTYDQ